MGVISIADLVPALISSRQRDYHDEIQIPVSNLLNVLQLNIIQGQIKEDFKGNVYVFSDLTYYQRISKNGLIICNQNSMVPGSFSLEPEYRIVADVHDNTMLKTMPDFKGVIFSSQKNIYELVQNKSGAAHIGPCQKEDLEYFALSEDLEDVKKNMMSSKYTSFPVVNEHGNIQGMISEQFTDVNPKEVITVDHNERAEHRRY